jgi:hypothetical protein
VKNAGKDLKGILTREHKEGTKLNCDSIVSKLKGRFNRLKTILTGKSIMEAECCRETGKYGKAEAEGVYRDHNSMGSTRILKDDRLGGQEEARRYRRYCSRHVEKSAEKIIYRPR